LTVGNCAVGKVRRVEKLFDRHRRIGAKISVRFRRFCVAQPVARMDSGHLATRLLDGIRPSRFVITCQCTHVGLQSRQTSLKFFQAVVIVAKSSRYRRRIVVLGK
jgi:hypothetical protein